MLQKFTPRSGALRIQNQNAGLMDSGKKKKMSIPSKPTQTSTGSMSAATEVATEVHKLTTSLHALSLG
jgi:hypothetical protein